MKEISIGKIKDNLVELISKEWMLIGAGDQKGFNMMTASWGFFGEIWGKDCAVAVIRPGRYTYEFIESNDYFSLSFLGDMREAYNVCGTKSGRDIDKAAATGLTPLFDEESVRFEQARITVICKKLYAQDLDENCFIDKSNLKWYNGDFHRVYVGQIVKVLVK